MSLRHIERNASINGHAVIITVQHDGVAYHVSVARPRAAAPFAWLPEELGPYMPAVVTLLQRKALDAAREKMGTEGQNLEDIANEMQLNGELASARSLHRSLRGRR